MNTDTIIQNTFGQVMTNAAQAMSDAVKQYGPDAVELGLVVYRISALQEIVMGLGLLIICVGLLVWFRFLIKWQKEASLTASCADFPVYGAAAVFVFMGGVGCFFSMVGFLSNVYNWAALFGYPEVLITYKALVAAGLM